MPTPDPKKDLRDFVRSNFDGSAISTSFTPADDVVIANYDVGPAFPEVAIVSADPITPGGGETGATGYDAGGGGLIQDTIWELTVDCWGGPHQEYSGGSTDADTVAEELGQELHETCRVGEGGPSGYEWLFAQPPADANDTEAQPTEYRRQVVARLKYTYTP